MLTIKDLSFTFGEKGLLDRMSLDIERGEIVCLMGASGCGKTTLLRLIMGLEPMQSGTIAIDGLLPLRARSQISYMVQEDLLLPWRTVLDNLLLLAELQNAPLDAYRKRACDLLDRVGLSSSAQLYPHQLSKGMRQRVSLARALLQGRSLLLLDEPFGALDVVTREEIYQLILDFHRMADLTILFTTHDFRDALLLADRISFLSRGKVEREWKIEDKERKDPFKLFQFSEEMRQSLFSQEGKDNAN